MATVPSPRSETQVELRLYHPRPDKRRWLYRRGRLAVLAGVVCFTLGQIGWLLLQERQPTLRDPEFAYKEASLRKLWDARNDRPLLVMLGSSRVNHGFCPQAVPPCRDASGRETLLFNFGINGSGPLQNLLCLHRLLRHGFRPQWVLLEVWPFSYTSRKGDQEWEHFDLARLDWGDLQVLSRFVPEPRVRYLDWLNYRLTPFSASRFVLMNTVAPDWLTHQVRGPAKLWAAADTHGWLGYDPPYTPAMRQAHVSKVRDIMLEDFAHAPTFFSRPAVNALREFLQVCRREEIGTALLLFPEGPLSQTHTPPELTRQTRRLLAEVRQDYPVPLVDMRQWMPEEDFWDSVHLHSVGARKFSVRLGREVLQPLLK